VLGLPVHLVLGGSAPATPEGNQALSVLFGAELHFAGTSRWEELEAAKDALVARLRAEGRRPAAIPIGGSTPVGALGFAEALVELVEQCDAAGFAPRTVVVTTSSGGTHAGLLAGRAALRAEGAEVPEVVAVAVAPGVAHHLDLPLGLAGSCLELLGLGPTLVGPADVVIDASRLGPGYAVPTTAGDDAVRWAARRGGWVLDRTYTGKGFAGVLGAAAEGRWGPDDDVVFWHTGGQPAVFAHDGLPPA
jgi:1-aminocyclopropane-1-carboxylate deaminase/D-cysteine desulfhydrase-like pyridoxal-dependent ACC family enzyme